jgi:hypothetical protein
MLTLVTVVKFCLLFPYTQSDNAWLKAEAFISLKNKLISTDSAFGFTISPNYRTPNSVIVFRRPRHKTCYKSAETNLQRQT